MLTFVSIGSAYLLVSVGVTIYRRRNAVPLGAPVGASAADLESCAEELTDVEQALERHLDNFDHLVAHYDADEAQRWDEDRAFWMASGRRRPAAAVMATRDPGRSANNGNSWP